MFYKYIKTAIAVILIIIVSSCSYSLYDSLVGVSEQEVKNDPAISYEAKMVWHSSLTFIIYENNMYDLRGFRVSIDKKTKNVRVYEHLGHTLNESQELLKKAFTSINFKKYYYRDEVLKEALCKIDTSFFDISNGQKLIALEKYIATCITE